MDLMATNWRRRVVRVALWGCAGAGLLLLCLVLSARSVAAELSEQGLQLGRSLGAWQQFTGRETRVVWNGQELSFHVRTVSEPMAQVLSEFARACGSERNRTAQELAASMRQTLGDRAPGDLSHAMILREQRGDAEGTAMCFAGLAEAGLSEAVERLRRFAVDLDLNELGTPRYLYARKIPAGTQLFFITAEGPFSLQRVWPEEGKDAEGSEPIAGARPKAAVRFMSVRTLQSPYAMTAYQSTLNAAQLITDYAAQAQTLGYETLDQEQLTQGLPAQPKAAHEFRVLRNGDAVLIATAVERRSGSVMSVVELPKTVVRHDPEQL